MALSQVTESSNDTIGYPRIPIILCAFGRGGSNLLFSAIASSPDVWSMAHEWHQVAYGHSNFIPKTLRAFARSGYLRNLAIGNDPISNRFRHSIRERMIADLHDGPEWKRPDARYMAVKLMDHNVWRLGLVHQIFGDSRIVVLTRKPTAQCESLIRSGLSLDEACRWYIDVSAAMARAMTSFPAIILRFEDLIRDPNAYLARLFGQLQIRDPGQYLLKKKPYGSARQPDTDVADVEYELVQCRDLRQFIDPDVNEQAVRRLSASQNERIRDRTHEAGLRLGYD